MSVNNMVDGSKVELKADVFVNYLFPINELAPPSEEGPASVLAAQVTSILHKIPLILMADMLVAVEDATVLIMNPTHYAVALKYEEGSEGAPVCVAKGADETALRMRQVANDNGVPVIENPPLARALFAAAKLDEEIPVEHYEAAAKVIGYVLGKAREAKR